ncbi:MAG: hypothetical protein ACPG5B_14905 [Chitinophagales bacterium]
MKDINELVEELAKLYGIEIIDKPNSHVVELEDGTRRTLDEEDFYTAMGLSNKIEKEIYHYKKTIFLENTTSKHDLNILLKEANLNQTCFSSTKYNTHQYAA